MENVDISKLSISQLDKLMIQVKELATKKRIDERKSLVAEFLQKAKNLDVSTADLIQEIKSRETETATKKPKKSNVIVKPKSWVNGATYCDPNGIGKAWIGGTKGPKPPWLVKLTPESLTPEELTAEYSKLLKP